VEWSGGLQAGFILIYRARLITELAPCTCACNEKGYFLFLFKPIFLFLAQWHTKAS